MWSGVQWRVDCSVLRFDSSDWVWQLEWYVRSTRWVLLAFSLLSGRRLGPLHMDSKPSPLWPEIAVGHSGLKLQLMTQNIDCSLSFAATTSHVTGPVADAKDRVFPDNS